MAVPAVNRGTQSLCTAFAAPRSWISCKYSNTVTTNTVLPESFALQEGCQAEGSIRGSLSAQPLSSLFEGEVVIHGCSRARTPVFCHSVAFSQQHVGPLSALSAVFSCSSHYHPIGAEADYKIH